MSEEKTVMKILDEVIDKMCDKYCKYPEMDPPEGESDGWLLEDGSPCDDCPLNRLR